MQWKQVLCDAKLLPEDRRKEGLSNCWLACPALARTDVPFVRANAVDQIVTNYAAMLFTSARVTDLS